MRRTSVIIFAIYRTGPISTEFFNELTSLFELLVAYSCPIIMTGDVNIHLDVSDDRDTQQFNDILDSFGLIQSVRGSTHLNGRTLDVVVSRSDLPPPIVQVGLPGEFSDHSLLVFQLPIPRPPPSFISVSTRSWKDFDEGKFRDELLASPLCSPSILSSELSVDELQDIYDSTLAALVDRHAPRRTTRRRHQPTTPWFDSDCAAAKRRARMLERRYRVSRNIHDRAAWSKQVRLKQQLYSQKQNEYWEKRISGSRGDPKKLWRSLSSVLRKEKTKLPDSDELSADRFSDAFQAKLDRVRSSTASAPPPTFDGPSCSSELQSFHLLDVAAVIRLINSAASKYCELDPAPTWLIKKFANELSSFIVKLFNTSLTSGTFSSSQKQASVTPALKKSTLDPFDLGNYRPISNLTFVSKLLERVAHEQITGYASTNHLLPDNQSAYQKHRSTETATLKVLSDVYQAADMGKITLLGMLDLSAAFDTVDHQILLNRLRHSFGITGTVLRWISSYLTGRTQFVRFNGSTSRITTVTSGVPQGSVLGPVLFLMYTADVVRVIEKNGFNVHAYADDLQIYDHTVQSGTSFLLRRMSACIEDVAIWMSTNRLCLNPSKTELIWLGSSRRLQLCNLDEEMILSGTTVRPVDCVRDLGVLVDKGITLTNHVNKVAGLCYFHLRQLRIIRRALTNDTAHSLVRALIHNRIDYCNGVLASSPKYLIAKLQSVLRVAARLILRLPSRSSVSAAMRVQLHWLNMDERISFKIALLAYKSIHGLAPAYLSTYCIPVSSLPGRSHLRSAGEWKMLVPRTKTVTLGPRGFFWACPSTWNALPVPLRDFELSLDSFKRKLKSHFFST